MRVSRRSLLGVAGVAVAGPALALSPTRGSVGRELDAMLRTILPRTGDPGLAVVVVQAGRVVHLGGYGFRDVAQRLAVGPDTRFPLGSLTKGMTAVLALTLVREGRLQLDQPAREIVPELVMPPESGPVPPTTADLLSHRTGMPAHNLVWYGAPDLGGEELARRIRHLQPITPVRGGFRYNNLMYAVAGLALERAGGEGWEALFRRRLAEPLGLDSAAVDLAFGQGGDVAQGYYLSRGRPQPMAPRRLGAVAPAGGVSASMRDMAHYLNMLVGRGRRILPDAAIETLWTPLVRRDGPQNEPGADPVAGYGLGFNVDRYHGHRRTHHTGSIDGFHARLLVFPDRETAVLAVSNAGGSRSPEIAGNMIADRLLDLPPTDWFAHYAPAPPAAVATPVAFLSGSAVAGSIGRYTHPAYGALDIDAGPDGHARLRFHGLSMLLRAGAAGVWTTAPETPDLPLPGIDAPVRFEGGDAVTVGFEAKVAPIRFVRA